jgi:hypothetical protein
MENGMQEKGKEPVNIPYIAHEADMARMERIVKRLWILLIISLAALIGTNVAWVVHESQFQAVDVTQEVEQQADGNGDNRFIGGDAYGTSEGDYTD